jgi:hypothetical protein
VSEYDLTPDDTAAMRAQGNDWREYLRSEMGRGKYRAEQAAKPKPPPAPPPGRRPGAWPPGTRPPDPPPPVPDADIAQALAAYRANPDQDHPCQCPACQQLTGGNR